MPCPFSTDPIPVTVDHVDPHYTGYVTFKKPDGTTKKLWMPTIFGTKCGLPPPKQGERFMIQEDRTEGHITNAYRLQEVVAK